MLNRQKRRLLVPFLAPALLLYGSFFLYPGREDVLRRADGSGAA